MERVVILTGGNLGDVVQTLSCAEELLSVGLGEAVAQSTMMESKAWGFQAENKFLNQVLVFQTDLLPEAVLDWCQRVETQLGRKRDPKAEGYESRPIDIDILFYGDQIIDSPKLKIPHPLIAQREFVLRPLDEIMPNYVHPQLGVAIGLMLRSF